MRTNVLVIPFHEDKLNSKGNKSRTQHQISRTISNNKSKFMQKKGSNITP